MAAVTINNTPYFNVSGSVRDQFYNISGNPNDTLQVGLNLVRQVVIEPSAITGYTVAPASPAGAGSVITFAAGSAFTGVDVQVLGN